MKKECKVHMLPTEDNTLICTNNGALEKEIACIEQPYTKMGSTVPQHLYITSDEEIKIDDYIMVMNHNEEWSLVHYTVVNKLSLNNTITSKRKIIATTDTLIIPENGYTDHLPQIPQSFLKEYCAKGGIDTVNVEYEEDKLYAHGPQTFLHLKLDSNDSSIIHPVKEKMYSKDEVEQFLFKYAEDEHAWFSTKSEIESFNKWIKENL